MNEKCKEPIADFLELVEKMNYFTKLKPDTENGNLFKTDLELNSYSELNLTISSLLKTSITILKNDASEVSVEAMLLIEIAVKLLPHDEMELLDEVYRLMRK